MSVGRASVHQLGRCPLQLIAGAVDDARTKDSDILGTRGRDQRLIGLVHPLM